MLLQEALKGTHTEVMPVTVHLLAIHVLIHYLAVLHSKCRLVFVLLV